MLTPIMLRVHFFGFGLSPNRIQHALHGNIFFAGGLLYRTLGPICICLCVIILVFALLHPCRRNRTVSILGLNDRLIKIIFSLPVSVLESRRANWSNGDYNFLTSYNIALEKEAIDTAVDCLLTNTVLPRSKLLRLSCIWHCRAEQEDTRCQMHIDNIRRLKWLLRRIRAGEHVDTYHAQGTLLWLRSLTKSYTTRATW